MNKNKILNLISLSDEINLLYVEDNKDVRETIGAILANLFKNLHIGVDGEDGLKLFTQNSIDLVITDVNMPKIDGIQMAAQIKKIDQSVEVIIVSAHNEEDYIKKSQEIGIDTYLYKPLELKQLVDTLLETLENMKETKALI